MVDTVDRIQCPPRGSCKVLSGTSIRILPASRYIFAVQRASYSICSTPKAPEQSPCSHVLAYIYIYIHIYVSCLNLTLPLYVYVCVCVYRTRNDNDVCSSLCRGYIYITGTKLGHVRYVCWYSPLHERAIGHVLNRATLRQLADREKFAFESACISVFRPNNFDKPGRMGINAVNFGMDIGVVRLVV